MRRKNTKFIDPRYFMDEKMEKANLNESLDPRAAELMQQLRAQYEDRQAVDMATCKQINKLFQDALDDPLAGPCVYAPDGGGVLELDQQ